MNYCCAASFSSSWIVRSPLRGIVGRVASNLWCRTTWTILGNRLVKNFRIVNFPSIIDHYQGCVFLFFFLTEKKSEGKVESVFTDCCSQIRSNDKKTCIFENMKFKSIVIPLTGRIHSISNYDGFDGRWFSGCLKPKIAVQNNENYKCFSR